MSFDFAYTRDRLPSRYSICLIWTRKKDKESGEEWISMNLHPAELDYHTEENGCYVWRSSITNEILNNQDVVKYIEIPQRYWSGVVKKGKLSHRLKMFLQGVKYVDKDYSYEPKLYSPTIYKKIRCTQCTEPSENNSEGKE